MRYREPLYRPPSEAYSLLIQTTYGCPWNRCAFCGMYKGLKYQVRSVVDVKKDMFEALSIYGPDIETIFFPDGNTIAMPTPRLSEICKYAMQLFPKLKRITAYGSAMFVLKKSAGELELLRQSGLKRIHMGMESGHEPTLKMMNKGVSPKQIVQAGRMVVSAGFELSEYYLVGLGGNRWWREHAIESARVLNAIRPRFVRLRTLYPVPNAPLYSDILEGKFELCPPHVSLMEIRLFLETLEAETEVLSDHISNYVDINGWFPRDKKKLLSRLEQAMNVKEEELRPKITSPGL
ncbi:MAG: radical SAM protein [Deltaproteobacteria bacterium]|nr:radical SAM protein [Deltaproteobacteria bacterium]